MATLIPDKEEQQTFPQIQQAMGQAPQLADISGSLSGGATPQQSTSQTPSNQAGNIIGPFLQPRGARPSTGQRVAGMKHWSSTITPEQMQGLSPIKSASEAVGGAEKYLAEQTPGFISSQQASGKSLARSAPLGQQLTNYNPALQGVPDVGKAVSPLGSKESLQVGLGGPLETSALMMNPQFQNIISGLQQRAGALGETRKGIEQKGLEAGTKAYGAEQGIMAQEKIDSDKITADQAAAAKAATDKANEDAAKVEADRKERERKQLEKDKLERSQAEQRQTAEEYQNRRLQAKHDLMETHKKFAAMGYKTGPNIGPVTEKQIDDLMAARYGTSGYGVGGAPVFGPMYFPQITQSVAPTAPNPFLEKNPYIKK